MVRLNEKTCLGCEKMNICRKFRIREKWEVLTEAYHEGVYLAVVTKYVYHPVEGTEKVYGLFVSYGVGCEYDVVVST